MRKLLISGAALAILVAAACSSQPAPRPTAITPPSTATSQARDYVAKQEFSQSEFEQWVDNAEKFIAEKTGQSDRIKSLEGAITSVTKQPISYVFTSEPIESSSDGLHAYAMFMAGLNKVLIERSNAMFRLSTLTSQYGVDAATAKKHELLHFIQDIFSEKDNIESFLAGHGVTYYTVQFKGRSTILIIPADSANNDIGELKINPFYGGVLIFDARIPIEKAGSIIEAYQPGNLQKSETGYEALITAGTDLSQKLLQFGTTKPAVLGIMELQANYAAGPIKDVTADGSDALAAALRGVGRNGGKTDAHEAFIRKALSDIVAGYYLLEKAGRNDADITMAQLVGKSTIGSNNQFAPYKRLTELVDELSTQLNIQRPTQQEASRQLLKRKQQANNYPAELANALAEYTLETVVYPQVRQDGKLVSIIPESDLVIKQTETGYEVKMPVTIRQITQ